MPAWVVTVTLTAPTGVTGDMAVIDVAEGDLRDVGEVGAGDGNDGTAGRGAAAGARRKVAPGCRYVQEPVGDQRA